MDVGSIQKSKKLIIFLVFAVILISTQICMADAVKLWDFGRNKVVIKCLNGNISIPDADIEIYKLRNGIPAEKVAELQTNLHGHATLKLPPGEYAVQAYLDGESGYHGYKTFKINAYKKYTIIVDMKPNLDNSHHIDLTPTIENMVIEENTTPIKAIYATPGKEGEETVPILLKNQALNNKDNWVRVDLEKLDPKTRKILMAYQEKLLDLTTNNNTRSNFRAKDVGDIIWFNWYTIGVVESEEKIIRQHRVMLVDSEPGLTHTMDLTVHVGTEMEFESEMVYSGIEASGSYTKSIDFYSSIKITVENGQCFTIKQRFEHTYQHGSVYYIDPWTGWWFYLGDFDREFITDWKHGDDIRESGKYLPEVRDNDLALWGPSQYGPYEGKFGVTTSSEYTGSVGLSVAKDDIFGASAKITFKLTYTVEKEHTLYWDYNGYNYYLHIYSGRLFDVNMYMYYAGGSGGCPILYVYNGSEYVAEGLLNIHNPNESDVIVRHILTATPKAVDHAYLLRLVEHPKTHSYIDHVKLYAVLESGEIIELPLISAVHSEYGNVLPQLLFSDDWRTETIGANFNNGTSQSIELRFLAVPEISHLKVAGFIFVIEGYNPYIK